MVRRQKQDGDAVGWSADQWERMIRSEPLVVSAPRRRHDRKRNGFAEKSKRSATHGSECWC